MSSEHPFADREVPAWFSAAKLGIFIHWTPASVPAFAPLTDDPFTLADQHGWEYAMAHSPYSEWYQNSLGLEGSPVQQHHAATYAGRRYEAFIDDFSAGHHTWNPTEWATQFAATGARYVVLVTKHHDGYLMWPSTTPNPTHGERWSASRDLVGELGRAIRTEGMKWGVYYSGGLDWTFGGLPITGFTAMLAAIPRSGEYAEYCEAHWRELIDREQPDILWNDIHHATAGDAHALFAYYYDRVPEGVVNDRFDVRGVRKGTHHADYVTPEYRMDNLPKEGMWEICRGIGRSFGYNQLETEDDYVHPDDLVWMFVDIVARGGNLLLNVGPKPDGSIPEAQQVRLEALGRFTSAHEVAIFESQAIRGMDYDQANATSGYPTRFTLGADGHTYAFVQVRSSTSPIAPGMNIDITFPDGTVTTTTCEADDGPVLVIRST